MTVQIEHKPSVGKDGEAADPYAYDPDAAFPANELNEVRPTGSTLRRGRGWALVVLVAVAFFGIIAWDKMSKSKPAAANGTVTAYGVGTIPLKAPTPEEVAAETKKTDEQEKIKKSKPKPPPKRESALASTDAFENPSQKYAEREVASWNPEKKTKRNDAFANRRKTALGN